MKVSAACCALLLAGTAGACTSFVDFSSASPWYGMNFDWHPQMDILFRIESAEDGTRIFTMSFVTEQGPVPTLGVTEDGRFCNMQVTDAPWTGPEPSGETPYIWTPFYAVVYGGASLADLEGMVRTVTFAQYDDPPLHVMAADPCSAAMIIEVGENGNEVLRRGDEPFLVMTNFDNTAWIGADPDSIEGDGADRYRRARAVLVANQGSLDEAVCMSVLESAASRDEHFPTRASMVFDVAHELVYIAPAGRFDEIWSVDIGTGRMAFESGGCGLSTMVLDSSGVTVSSLLDGI
jgi:hypothetical protein